MHLTFIVLMFISMAQACEQLLSSLCGDLYNSTTMPNSLGHVSQTEAAMELAQFKPIIDIKCDTDLRSFLCRLYFPECINHKGKQPTIADKPCNYECRRVYENCYPLLRKFGFGWPSHLNCSTFPSSGKCKVPTYESCNIRYDANECVKYTKMLARDKSSFWFGSQYLVTCPKGIANGWSCMNRRATYADSIESRLDGAVTLDQLSYPLNITFTTYPGRLKGCGGDFSQHSKYSFSPSPMADKYHHPAVQTRTRPEVKWPAIKGKLYSLVIYDISTLYLHGVYCNIQNGNLNESDEVINYFQPLPPTSHPNVLLYLLFEQNQYIDSDVMDKTKSTPKTDHVKTTISTLGLTNLVAINWVNVVRDEFSAGKLIQSYGINACPDLMSDELTKHHRSFLPKLINLTYSVDVTYTSSPLTYKSCCKTYYTKGNTLYLRPLSNGTVDTATVRTGLTPNVQIIPFGFLPGNTEGLFTLIMVDPDVSHASVGTPDKPLVHWLVINIPNGTVSHGDTLETYLGPAPPPPSKKDHTYYFLHFKQAHQLSAQKIKGFVGQNCPVIGRCLFDLQRFQQDESVVLVGATWMLAHNDPYIRHMYVIERGNNIDDVCHGVKDYPNVCSNNILG